MLLDGACPAMLAMPLADPLAAGAPTVIQAEQGATATSVDQGISYNPEEHIASIFEGSDSTPETTVTSEDGAAGAAQDSTDQAGITQSEGQSGPGPDGATANESTAGAVDPGISNPITDRLTTTLRAANGPPQLDRVNEFFAHSLTDLPGYMSGLAMGATLNSVINALLAAHFLPTDPNPSGTFTFTNGTDPLLVPTLINIGRTLGGGVDLQLENVTLTFSNLAFVSGSWTGQVGVEAEKGTLFAGLLDIPLVDDGLVGDDEGDDADSFAIAGVIDLAVGASAELNFDDLDAEELGFPAFLDISFTELALEFADFRGDDNLNSLAFRAVLAGFDTGDDTLNDLISADNPLFGLSIQGSVSVELEIDEIEDAVQAASGGNVKDALEAALATAMATELKGIEGRVSGNLFMIATFEAAFIFNEVTHDPDGAGPLPERSSSYLAVEGSFSLGEAILGEGGNRHNNWGLAFAVSDLGPLQFFISGGPIKLTPITIEQVRLGVRFNTTIEDLQTGTDFAATAAQVAPVPGSDYRITLTIPDHNLALGDDFRVRNAANGNYNGDFTVLAVNGDLVTFELPTDPGLFVGSAEVIRLTITDPLDLRDEGLKSGIAPPENITVWRSQLDQAVRNQIASGNNVWEQLIDEVVLGGGATVSIDPVPDYLLLFDSDFMIDTEGRIFLGGRILLGDGFVKFPAKLYADLSEILDGSGRFLFLCDIPELEFDVDPLLVLRGEVAFEPLEGADVMNAAVTRNTAGGFWEIKLTLPLDNPSDEYRIGDKAVIFGARPPTGIFNFDGTYDVIAVDDTANTITLRSATDPGAWVPGSVGTVVNENALDGGFRIVMEGGVDLNIPSTTTLTLEGGVAIEFRVPGTSVPEDLAMNLYFDATLSETNFGNIAEADGAFHVTVDADVPQGSLPVVEVWGAALLTTNFEFLRKIGLFASASGLLRVNSSDAEKPAEELRDVNNRIVTVALPEQSFALRLDGSVDFRIDFNGNRSFSTSESVFEIVGSFVLEFSSDGFNVAVFREVGGTVRAATLRLGPRGSPFLEFDVFAFLAIRENGIAANLVLTLNVGASGPLSSLISLNARFVLVVNTTGERVVFSIPGGAADPNRPPGVSVVTIPRAGPADPSTLATSSFDSLINGNVWTAEATPGPYGVLFFNGSMTLLSVVTLGASGFVSLNPDGLILRVSVSGTFLSLVSISGTASFNSDGEFYMTVGGSITLGTSSTNISGSASLTLSYWDSNQLAFGGTGNKNLAISGSLGVSAKIFGVSLGSFTLTVSYSAGAITVGVPYPEPYWDSSCWSTAFGDVCVYYPNVRTAYYYFTIGHINSVGSPPPPPVVLGQLDGNGVLTLNVGPMAGARNLLPSELNESVIFEAAPGSQRGQRIIVTMFGVTREFDNVIDIQVGDMAEGADAVEISNSVTTNVTVHFGSGSDTLTNHGPAMATAYGDGDNDRLTGGTGNDRLFGGLGDDFIDGQAGQDWIEGGDGAEILIGGGEDDTIKGGAGVDQIAGGPATLMGDAFGSTLQTQASATGGNDTLEGGEDADFILGGGGQDNILGGSGRDVLIGDDGTVSVSSIQGFTFTVADLEFGANDVIDGGPENDRLFGGRGDDTLSGGTGADEIQGGVGNDLIKWIVGEGDDRIDGQSGSDSLTVIASDSSEQITVSAKDAGFMVSIGAETLTVDGVETSDIEGRQGGDVFVVDDLTSSVLRQVNLKLGNSQDAVNVHGSSDDDAFTIAPIGNIVHIQKTGGATVDIYEAGGLDLVTLMTWEGADMVNVLATRPGTVTSVFTGAGADIINVGSVAPARGGIVDGIAAFLWVQGESDSDTLNVDDSGDADPNTGTLTATAINGLDMDVSILYAAFESLNIGLGSGSDTFTIESTHAGTTQIDTNAGNDTVHVQGSAGATVVNTGADQDTVNLLTIGAPAVVNSGDGNDTINVSSDAPANNGTLDGILGALTIDAGEGVNMLNISDEASGSPDLHVVITANSITGLGPAIDYAATGGNFAGGINIEAGSGGNRIEVRSTHSSPGSTTTLWSGNGSDIVIVTATTAGSLVIHGQAGNDLILGAGAATDLVITGDSRDDVIIGGSGNDLLIGNEGDDQIIGGLGSDDIRGGEGRDVLLGDTGVITRSSNPDGSWRWNVLLNDVGIIDASYNLNGDVNGALASAILNADLLLLTGAYNADGSRHLTPEASGPQQWETRLLLISLLPDGNDALDGAGGDDALFGGRGNDQLTGGVGRDYIEGGAGDDTLDGGDDDDVLVGDSSTAVLADGVMPNVFHGLHLALADTRLVPMLTIVPGHDIHALTSVLPHIAGDLALIPTLNALVDADGTRHAPLASVVPEVAYHRALLAGNDTVHGGAGNDQLTGDNSTTLVRSLNITPEWMGKAERMAADLLQITDDWADLARDLSLAVAERGPDRYDKQTVVVDGTFQIGNDTLQGGVGLDILVGDDSVLCLPSVTVPLRLADDLHRFFDDLDRVEDEVADASHHLSNLQHLLRDVVTQVPYGKNFQIHVQHHVDRLLAGNDVLDGGNGNDLLVGDDWSQLAPSVTITAQNVPSPWDRDDNRRNNDRSRGDSDPHDDRQLYHDANDVLMAGNDTLSGGAGNDLIFGDSAALLASTVTVSPVLNRSDSSGARHQGENIAEHLLGLGHHGWHDHDATGGDDAITGGDGDDLLFGQAGRDTLRGGAGNDWLIGGDDPDVLDDSLGNNKLHQGENDSKALRETLAGRLSDFGLFDDPSNIRHPPTIKYKLPRILLLGL